jgi:hypothetical protein
MNKYLYVALFIFLQSACSGNRSEREKLKKGDLFYIEYGYPDQNIKTFKVVDTNRTGVFAVLIDTLRIFNKDETLKYITFPEHSKTFKLIK